MLEELEPQAQQQIEGTYACCLEDFGQARKVIHARIKNRNGRVK